MQLLDKSILCIGLELADMSSDIISVHLLNTCLNSCWRANSLQHEIAIFMLTVVLILGGVLA